MTHKQWFNSVLNLYPVHQEGALVPPLKHMSACISSFAINRVIKSRVFSYRGLDFFRPQQGQGFKPQWNPYSLSTNVQETRVAAN